MSHKALRVLVAMSAVNAVLTLAFPSALVALFFLPELSSALRWLAVFSLFSIGVYCYTILGLRRYLATACGFDGASRALAVHAGLSAGFGVALLVGWGVLRLGSSDSALSWTLGLTVLGFFLLAGIAIGVLELLIGLALGQATAEGYGLLGPIRVNFLILGISNLVSIVLGVTVVVGVVAYAVVSILLFLLFRAAWREGSGRLPEGFRYGKRWLAAVAVALIAVSVPTAVAIQQLRTLFQEEEFEVLEEESEEFPEPLSEPDLR